MVLPPSAGAPVRAVELEEVEALEDPVAELRVGDSLVGVESGSHGLLPDIWLTGKCLPMSRRKSSALRGAVQSRLLTMMAAFSPSKSRKG